MTVVAGCFNINIELEDTARYAGLLLAPAEGLGLRPRLFLPFGQKKSLLCCFGPFLAFFGVHPVSESRGGPLSVTEEESEGRKSLCLILDYGSYPKTG